jgi:hypothetical protein
MSWQGIESYRTDIHASDWVSTHWQFSAHGCSPYVSAVVLGFLFSADIVERLSHALLPTHEPPLFALAPQSLNDFAPLDQQ